jgi:hypothetical protein
VRPGRQCPYQYKDQDDEKDRAKHCDTGASSRYSTNVRRQKQVPRVKHPIPSQKPLVSGLRCQLLQSLLVSVEVIAMSLAPYDR